mgnify:FL=1
MFLPGPFKRFQMQGPGFIWQKGLAASLLLYMEGFSKSACMPQTLDKMCLRQGSLYKRQAKPVAYSISSGLNSRQAFTASFQLR